MRKVNFPLSAISSFLHSSSFPGIEEKTNSQEPGKLIFPQVKCHILCFVLIPGKKVPGPREMVFELEKLIVPYVYPPCFTFGPRDLVLTPREMILGHREKAYNPGKNCPPMSFPLCSYTFGCKTGLVLSLVTN